MVSQTSSCCSLSSPYKLSCIPPVVTGVLTHSCFWSNNNFIDTSPVEQSLIPVEILDTPVNALDRRKLAVITHCTVPITLINSGNQREWYSCSSSPHPVLLLCWDFPGYSSTTPKLSWTCGTHTTLSASWRGMNGTRHLVDGMSACSCAVRPSCPSHIPGPYQ